MVCAIFSTGSNTSSTTWSPTGWPNQASPITVERRIGVDADVRLQVRPASAPRSLLE